MDRAVAIMAEPCAGRQPDESGGAPCLQTSVGRNVVHSSLDLARSRNDQPSNLHRYHRRRSRGHRHARHPRRGASALRTRRCSRATMPPAIAALTPMTRRREADHGRRATCAHRQGHCGSWGSRVSTRSCSRAERRSTTSRTSAGVLSERMLALIIPTKGTPFIVCPKFEEERAMEQVRTGPLDKGTEVHTWEEDESPSALIADGLRARGLATGHVRHRGDGPVRVLEQRRHCAADAPPDERHAGHRRLSWREVGGASSRSCDTPVQVTHKAYEAAWKSLADGMTQTQFAGLVVDGPPATWLPGLGRRAGRSSTRRCRMARRRRRWSSEGRSC